MANWWRCSAAATRKITQNTSATRWAPSVTFIEPRGATIVGHWPTAGYHFEASKGLADDDHFVGLAIDEDRQPELTNERVEKWVKQVAEELHLEEIKKRLMIKRRNH
ncbi:flavodoxin 1 [Klebsiella pneumoniae]|uniref:Flavodoxin 1 n=1 Tax=Klebsiella pneumoniae TaxID=573 RepID=A0A377XQJ2_KLEPN|nr:flavodoxin 1 [Klebsiella pneumoniae]